MRASELSLNDLYLHYASPPRGINEAEWRARVDLAAAYRLTHFYGWTSVVYNHITLRVPDTDTFLINPFGFRYDEITASNLILIDLDGNKVSESSDFPVNKAGYLIHSAIHRARPNDLHCVMHTHESYSQTLCSLNIEVLPMVQEACQFYGRVGYHEFEGIVLDASEQVRITKALGTLNHTLVLKNHGLITCGASAAWAFIRHQQFIRNAEIQLRAMASGAEISRIPEEVLLHTRDQFEHGDAQAGAVVRHPEWPAFFRLLDRIDPTWRT
jgi:ribulose-5-phosphate 4-epimerase/fuculose-1-phosphate aldolase